MEIEKCCSTCKYDLLTGYDHPCDECNPIHPLKWEPMDAEVPVSNTTTQETDNVNHPSHYTQGGIECIDALEAATEGLTGIEAVCTANAIKYLWRWKYKNGVEDLGKAIWYIKRLEAKIKKEKQNDTK